MPAINHLLREHVTRTGFDLSLSKNHITTLFYIVLWSKDEKWHIRERPPGRNLFVPSANGLLTRGLVTHNPHTGESASQQSKLKFGDYWKLTEAGELVYRLLEISGIFYDLELVPRPSPLLPDREPFPSFTDLASLDEQLGAFQGEAE